ncbi:quinone oxidoreductase family protein [Aquamicrobium terrae]|uniref:NADPH2:quinone reductase n=1 Tax=Aquamicrobium terrae TaxID=1324945 RepID=A0ABV2N0C8_9HYPH
MTLTSKGASTMQHETNYAIRIGSQGSPDVMNVVPISVDGPGKGEVLVRNLAVGFNFIDISQRDGRAHLTLPSGLGHEGVAIVDALGEGVRDFSVGERVAYINAGIGAYATRRIVKADRLIRVPDELETDQVAAFLFKGLTAQYLVRRTFKVAAGDLVVVHAAAGGVGSIVSGWARSLGATVIGTVGSDGKRGAALAAGCVAAVNYTNENWVDEILEKTGGRKAEVVYDSVGKNTVLKSLDCLKPFGLLVVFGMASGPSPAIDPELLNVKGCLFMTRPSVFTHNATTGLLRANAAELFETIRRSSFPWPTITKFPLSDVVKVHRAVEQRQLTGSVVFIP